MTLDATFWVTISFFIFIGILFYFKVPQKVIEILVLNISNQISEAEKLKEDAKNILIEQEKKISDSKTALNKDIQSKKEVIEKEIEKEILKAQKEISELKKNSISSIQHISENITANIIENISGDKLNESSIKAAVEETSKKNLSKYL